MASHETFCKNLVDYFRQAALVTFSSSPCIQVTLSGGNLDARETMVS
ncbi:hypothetical protein WH8501_14830 [Crocosphaera watsonii WH 8501]|nr:hypothetical protein [Crocosphaera watsonii]